MEINFHIDCKIAFPSWKWISVSILPSNDFHPRKWKREREKNSNKRSHCTRSWSVDRIKSWSVDRATTPNPRLQWSRRTLTLARLRRLKHHCDRDPKLTIVLVLNPKLIGATEIANQSSPPISFSTQSSLAPPFSFSFLPSFLFSTAWSTTVLFPSICHSFSLRSHSFFLLLNVFILIFGCVKCIFWNFL